VRIFKTKAFARLARGEVEDEALVEVVGAAERGLIDADLGGGVIKQRIARRGWRKVGWISCHSRLSVEDAVGVCLSFRKKQSGQRQG
jgi:hypothetical protein